MCAYVRVAMRTGCFSMSSAARVLQDEKSDDMLILLERTIVALVYVTARMWKKNTNTRARKTAHKPRVIRHDPACKVHAPHPGCVEQAAQHSSVVLAGTWLKRKSRQTCQKKKKKNHIYSGR